MRGVRQIVWLGMLGCLPAIHEPPDPSPPGKMGVHPSIVGQGVTLEFTVNSQNPVFIDGDTALSFGDGLVVQDLRVEDPQTVVTEVWVDDQAALGFRDVSVDVAGWTQTLRDAVQITDQSFTITPDSVRPGQIVDISLLGRNASWDEASWADFGEGTLVISMGSVGADFAIATVAIDPGATPGLRDVSVDGITLYDGLTIDRDGIAIDFDIPDVPQGAIIDFALSGDGIRWDDDLSIEFWDDGGLNQDVSVWRRVDIEDQVVSGEVRASNAANLGPRDVVIRNGSERLYIADAFQVTETIPTLEEVILSVSWDVHSQANARGEVIADGEASAVFFVPLDPPCGSAPPQTGPTGGFDSLELQPESGADPHYQCPTAKTLDAGPEIWLKSEESLVRLTREFVISKGYTRYISADTAPEDYPFDQTFDLITDGAGQIPEMVLPKIVQTVPGDVVLLNEEGRWHSRNEPLTVRWRPALSYPNAELILRLQGTLLGSGRVATFAGRPWDDGEIDVAKNVLQQLDIGPAEVRLSSSVEGRLFSLPFTDLTQPKATSEVSMSQGLELE